MPVQPSPAVQRAVRILRAVAEDPEREWTLSELSRAVGAHPSSAQTVVLALTEGGLLQRRAARSTFRPGPTLVALGERARRSIDLVDLAEPELEGLRDRHDATAMLGMVSGDTIVAASVRPSLQPLGYGVVPNMAVPFRAPVGSIYIAWAPAAEIEAWLERGRPEVGPGRARTLAADLAVVRDRGWSATVRRRDRRGMASYQEVRSTEASEGLALIGVSAPVRAESGPVAASLALSTFPEPGSGAGLLAMAADLVSSAARLEVAAGLRGASAPRAAPRR